MIFDPEIEILVVFCRRPALGVGKQRIAAELGKQAALEVAELLLAGALEDASAWTGPVVLSPAAAQDHDWASRLLPNAIVISQDSGNLGRRIQDVQAQIRSRGGNKILFIGSDSPDLNAKLLATAADRLHDSDIVLIPARDGGVTLMGSRRPWPELEQLPWETPQLCKALQQSCLTAGLSTATLATSFDIDTRQDLTDSITLLADDRRPARHLLRQWALTMGLAPDEKTQQKPSDHKLSAIVPVYNDLNALQALLQNLQRITPSVDEIIVVDGGADPRCQQLCDDVGAAYFTAQPNRGAQLRLGADKASGDIFWFLHADSYPPENAVKLIKNAIAEGHTGGYFRFKFGGLPAWHKRWLAFTINLRTRFGIPYGDQALFVSRVAYTDAGGHAAIPLFEEVELIRQLRRQGSCTALDAPVTISPRRWERDGWLRRSLHNRYLAIAYTLGVAPERLARQYGRTSDK